MHDQGRVANLLGAAALALTDLTVGGATEAVGLSASGAAALVTLVAQPGVSVTELGRRVGLTQSAAARMVDSLQADDLVERRPNPYSRNRVTVHPTAAGRRAAHRLLTARARPLSDAVAALDDGERDELARLLTKMLERLYEHVGNAQYLCRLCDRGRCRAAGATCPVGQAEARDEGPATR